MGKSQGRVVWEGWESDDNRVLKTIFILGEELDPPKTEEKSSEIRAGIDELWERRKKNTEAI